jgi:hypothetical protein
MGLFSKILDKLGLNKKDKPTTPTPAASPDLFSKTAGAGAKPAAAPAAKPVTPTAAPKATAGPVPVPASPAYAKPAVVAPEPVKPAAPTPVSDVDVVKHLEQISVGKDLNWKVSIVDLLKLLELDSSFEARKEMAVELGCPAELMGDSAKMNTWLHKTVLKEIAKNGGNIPANLLD